MRRRVGSNSGELERVYREHVRAVYAFFAYSVTEPAAEDLTSATFERVVRAWPQYDARRGSERAWILTIARNQLTDHYRRQSFRAGPSIDEHPELVDRLTDREEHFEQRLTADELRGWLSVLSDREREILALRYAADLPGLEIAAQLGLSAANVHQILSRSLRRLRQAAEDAVPDPQGQRSTRRATIRER